MAGVAGRFTFCQEKRAHMAKICYQPKRFNVGSQDLINKSIAIIDDYAQQGYELTLRQLYYQMVARDLLGNTQREYKRLGSIINDARLAGQIDWDHITDLTREMRRESHWDRPADIIGSAADSFRQDKWRDQSHRVEVWVEKDALRNVVERACTPLDVGYLSCRGYVSQSEMWASAMRLKGYQDSGQTPIIIHLGDHDPSGVDMTRDITDRLAIFGVDLEVNRIALNMDQIEQYGPPPNPAKITDSRAASYIAEHGDESWELDALEPAVLHDLITETVKSYRNEKEWKQAIREEKQHRRQLSKVSDKWGDVVEFLAV
jgi:hypothetical protein